MRADFGKDAQDAGSRPDLLFAFMACSVSGFIAGVAVTLLLT
ncbi:MAG: hypothetical protein AB7O43_04565 [Hyphomicrobiaceae bacterium]